MIDIQGFKHIPGDLSVHPDIRARARKEGAKQGYTYDQPIGHKAKPVDPNRDTSRDRNMGPIPMPRSLRNDQIDRNRRGKPPIDKNTPGYRGDGWNMGRVSTEYWTDDEKSRNSSNKIDTSNNLNEKMSEIRLPGFPGGGRGGRDRGGRDRGGWNEGAAWNRRPARRDMDIVDRELNRYQPAFDHVQRYPEGYGGQPRRGGGGFGRGRGRGRGDGGWDDNKFDRFIGAIEGLTRGGGGGNVTNTFNPTFNPTNVNAGRDIRDTSIIGGGPNTAGRDITGAGGDVETGDGGGGNTVNTNPVITNPGGTDPGGTDPGGTDPGGTDPGGTDPGGTDPGGTDPGGTDPGGTDPGETTPGKYDEFINRTYNELLGRDAGQEGLDWWGGDLDRGASEQDVIDNIKRNPEYINREMAKDLASSMEGKTYGTPGNRNAPASLGNINEDSLDAWIGPGGGLTQSSDPTGKTYYEGVGDKSAAATLLYKPDETSGENVLTGWPSDLTERDEAIYNLYTDVMGRNPDPSGLKYWTGAGGEGMSLADIEASFRGSAEAKLRDNVAGTNNFVSIDDYLAGKSDTQSGGNSGTTTTTTGTLGVPPLEKFPTGWCPTPDMKILLSDKSQKPAGELQVGDEVRTAHEKDFTIGNYKVTRVELVDSPIVKLNFEGKSITCSPTHKFYSETDDDWTSAEDLKEGDRVALEDGEIIFIDKQPMSDGKVVSITVDDAHTYICEGFLSHNKTLAPESHPDHPDYDPTDPRNRARRPISDKVDDYLGPNVETEPDYWEGPGPEIPLPEIGQPKRDPITTLYKDLLGRSPDAEGGKYWSEQLRSGKQTYDQIADNIMRSDEYQKRKAERDTGWTPGKPDPTPIAPRPEPPAPRPAPPTPAPSPTPIAPPPAPSPVAPPPIVRAPKPAPVASPPPKPSDWLQEAYTSAGLGKVDSGGRDYWTGDLAKGQTKAQVIANIMRHKK